LHFLRGQGLNLTSILLQNGYLRVLLLLEIESLGSEEFLSSFFGSGRAFLEERE
jgi:hypothetical protein